MSKKFSVSDYIFDFLTKAEAVGDTLVEFVYQPNRFIYKDFSEAVSVKESNLRSALKRLEKGGVVEVKMKNERSILYRLTAKGQLVWLKKKLAQEIRTLTGGFVLALFDIPEDSRVIRNALRRNLREFGFKPWQKSVWVTNKDIFDLASKYFNLVGLSRYMVILETKKVCANYDTIQKTSGN